MINYYMKMTKKKLIIIGILAAIVAGVGLWFFWLSACFSPGGCGEDNWICQNGEWIKHGHPSAAKPTESCGETIKVKAYFNNDKMDPEFSCNKVFTVEREITKTQSVARAALEELLKGPTDSEKSERFFTSINPGVKIQKLTIENGVAKVDFDEQLEFQVGGSCRVAAISQQIIQTLKQFPTVKEVVISINGRTEDILQP